MNIMNNLEFLCIPDPVFLLLNFAVQSAHCVKWKDVYYNACRAASAPPSIPEASVIFIIMLHEMRRILT